MELSSDYVVRTRVQTWLAVAGIAGTIVFYMVPLVANGLGLAESTEFDLNALAIAAVVIAIFMPLFNFVGLARAPLGDVVRSQKRQTVSESWRAIRDNSPFIYFTLTFLLAGLTSGISQGVAYLYIDGYLGLGKQLAAIFLLAAPAMLIALPLWGVLCQKWERQKVWAASLSAVALCQVGYGLLQPGEGSLVPAVLLNLIMFAFIPCIFVAGPAMVGDVIDYGRWKFGQDHGGLYISVFSMTSMAVNALGVSIGLILLDWFGYDATASVQSAQGAQAMKLVAAWIPVCGTLVAIPLVWRFPLTRSRHAKLVADIEARKDAENSDGLFVDPAPVTP